MRSEVVIQEFGPDEQGQQVAWAYVGTESRAERDLPDITSVDLAFGHIGENGARYTAIDHEGEHLFHRDSVTGFTHASAINVVFPHGVEGSRNQNYLIRSAGRIFGHEMSSSEIMASGLGRGQSGAHDDTEWFTDGDNFLSRLKERYEEAGLDPTCYQLTYLLMGHLVLNERFAPNEHGQPYINPHNRVLVDTEMHDVTREEREAAITVLGRLTSEKLEDEDMLRRLTVFSDIPSDEIPEVFVASRERVSGLEAAAIQAASTALTQRVFFLPVGFRPSGRTWPYMDATVEPVKGYGQELQALRDGSVDQPMYELKKEIDELKKRIVATTQGSQAMDGLFFAEEKARIAPVR